MPKLKPKEMVFDFLETCLLIASGCFVLFYLVLGDRLGLAEDIVRSAVLLALLAMPFAFKLKMNHLRIRRYAGNGTIDEVIAYPLPGEIRFERCLIIFIGLVMLAEAAIISSLGPADYLQASAAVLLLAFWHVYFYRKRGEGGGVIFITKKDVLIDDIFLFFLPIAILSIPAAGHKIDMVDFLQAVTVLVLFYGWRLVFYRRQK